MSDTFQKSKPPPAIQLALAGAAGRMGRRIIALASADPSLKLVAALESDTSSHLGNDAGVLAGIGPAGIRVAAECDSPFDVMIDFTTASATVRWLDLCVAQRRPLVIGTTGHNEESLARISDAANAIAILKSPNMSVGVNVLLRAVEQIARALDASYDVEIVETHHRFKKDAPSGTALALKDAVDNGRGAKADIVTGRHGLTGERPAGQIGMHSLRIGDTVGEHEVAFGNLGETIRIAHAAHTRDCFATGALRAAHWIVRQKPGLYTMADVLFGPCPPPRIST